MIIVDTSIWIEFFKNSSSVFPVIRSLLEKQSILAVEWIFGELLQGTKNKTEREIIKSYWENLPKVNREDYWIEAGIFSSENKLFAKGIGLIDCAIIIAARKNKALIWSLDKKLNSVLMNTEKFSLYKAVD